MENKETFKVERGVSLPSGHHRKLLDAYGRALESMKIGDCLTINKCQTVVERGKTLPSNNYRGRAVSFWKGENCKPAQRRFYDEDGDMGLKIWKVKHGR